MRRNECGGMNAADAGGGCRRRMQEEEEGEGRHGIKAEPSPRGEENKKLFTMFVFGS